MARLVAVVLLPIAMTCCQVSISWEDYAEEAAGDCWTFKKSSANPLRRRESRHSKAIKQVLNRRVGSPNSSDLRSRPSNGWTVKFSPVMANSFFKQLNSRKSLISRIQRCSV